MKFYLPSLILLFSVSNCAMFSSLNSISTSSNTASTSLNSVSSISDSVKSISTSLKSISTSSSGGTSAMQKLYIQDIATLTELYSAKDNQTDFKNDVNRLALKSGILNYESDSITYEGIGIGLKRSQFSKVKFEELLNAVNPEVRKSLTKGYFSA